MPKIYEYLGIVFFFYSNEHLPIHIHAKFAEFETKFDLIFENGILLNILSKKVRKKEKLPSNKEKDAIEFISTYYLGITEKWNQFFVLKKSTIVFEKITKKIGK